MTALRSGLRHAVGLFVDDWATSTVLALWLVVCALLVPRLNATAAGAVLFAGVAVILIVSVGRAARRRSR